MKIVQNLLNLLQTAWHKSRGWLAGIALAAFVIAIIAFPILPVGRMDVQVGDVAPRDVRSPRRVSYISNILTEREQDRAEASNPPVYTPPDSRIVRQQIAYARRVMDAIRAARADNTITLAQKWTALENVAGISLSTSQVRAILNLSDDEWSQVETEVLSVVEWMMRSEIRQDELDQTRVRVPFMLSLALTEDQAAIADALAQKLIAPTSFLDSQATETARAQARRSVQPITRSYEAGEIIVREGQIVTTLDAEAMDYLGLRRMQASWGDFVAAGLYGIVVTVLMGLYVWRYETALWHQPRKLVLLVVLFLLFALVARVMLPGQSVLPYLFPASALPMLITVLIGPNLAILMAAALGILTGALGGSSETIVFVIGGGLVAALSLRQAERLSAFFRAGLYVTLVNIAILLAFRLPVGIADVSGALTLFAAGIANGSLAASLTVGGLFLMSDLFGTVTAVRLQELARTSHPLLEWLLTKAPGTYHHTRMVANLAEQAAERIGADALLTRVGALYHDIGKTSQPYVFIENQKEGTNIHDMLDTRTSAEIILQHVEDGLALARQHRLPRRVQAFIPEHQGTMRVGFLYERAIQQAGGNASRVDERAFRYRGPKPQSRETALVMLADGCEAAARAARPASAEKIREIVNKVIADRIAWGQLDECLLTLSDLDRIRESFAQTLQGVSHPRLQYPDTGKTIGESDGDSAPDSDQEKREG